MCSTNRGENRVFTPVKKRAKKCTNQAKKALIKPKKSTNRTLIKIFLAHRDINQKKMFVFIEHRLKHCVRCVLY